MEPEESTHKTVTFPPGKNSWLSPERVDYMSKLAQAIFLLMAFPYLFVRLVTKPAATFAGATTVHAAV